MKHTVTVEEKFKPTYKEIEIDLPMYTKWISKDKKIQSYTKIYMDGDTIVQVSASFYKKEDVEKDRIISDYIHIGKKRFHNYYKEDELKRIKRDHKATKALFEKKFKEATLQLSKG